MHKKKQKTFELDCFFVYNNSFCSHLIGKNTNKTKQNKKKTKFNLFKKQSKPKNFAHHLKMSLNNNSYEGKKFGKAKR